MRGLRAKRGESDENSRAAPGFAREDADVGPSIPQGEASRGQQAGRPYDGKSESQKRRLAAGATTAVETGREDEEPRHFIRRTLVLTKSVLYATVLPAPSEGRGKFETGGVCSSKKGTATTIAVNLASKSAQAHVSKN